MRPMSLPSGPNLSRDLEGHASTSQKHFVARATQKIKDLEKAGNWEDLFGFCHAAIFDILQDLY